MQPSDWVIVGAAAIVAALAGRRARGSRLAAAIALVGAMLATLVIVDAALGYAGCTARGDCTSAGTLMHTILGIALLILAVLVISAAVRAGWRRRPRRPRRTRRAGRMRARDISMAVGGVPFALFSIVLIAFGDGSARLGGVGCLLFSAAILLLPLSGRLAARSGIRPRLERVEQDGVPRSAIVIPGSTVKLRLMRLMLACFAGLGLLMAIRPAALFAHGASAVELRIGGILCAALFGGLLLARQVYGRGPFRIVLLESGLRWELGAGPTFVAWKDVLGAHVHETQGAWQLAIDARPGSRRDPPRQPWPARLDRALSRTGSSIPLEAFPVDPKRLAAVVNACAALPEQRPEVTSEDSLRWLTGQLGPAGPRGQDPAPPARETLSGA